MFQSTEARLGGFGGIGGRWGENHLRFPQERRPWFLVRRCRSTAREPQPSRFQPQVKSSDYGSKPRCYFNLPCARASASVRPRRRLDPCGLSDFWDSRERCFAIFTACAFLIGAFRRISTRPARRRASPYLVGTSGRGVAYGRTDVCAAFLTKSAPIFFQGSGGDGRDQDFIRRLTSWTVSSLCSCRQSLARFHPSINQREASSMNSSPRRCRIASRVAARVLGTVASFRAGCSDSGWNFCAPRCTAQIPAADWLIMSDPPIKRAFTSILQEAFGSTVTRI